MSNSKRTALITGATSGIGHEFAQVAAAHGHDLVLVARRADKLQEVARQLAGKYHVRAETIALDLSDPTSADALTAELERRQLTIDVLVNNAGYAQYGSFLQTEPEAERRMMQLNMVTLTGLAKKLAPGMVQRKFGRILNVASTAAFFPGPWMAVYYATKAYVLSFSEALAEELKGTGVTVTALCPGPTRTGYQARARMEKSKLVRGKELMDSATVARIGWDAMERGQPLVIPGMINRLQTLAPRLMPRRLMPRIIRRLQAPTGV